MSLEQTITQAWYQNKAWIRTLKPLSKLYEMELNRRRLNALSEQKTLFAPVVVVGNITVGGTGKTPLIIHLSQKLEKEGLSVGVISRGYLPRDISKKNKRTSRLKYPHVVNKAEDSADQVGDEPLMICEQTNATVVISPDRYAAAEYLTGIKDIDVILSDDGMQHFGLPRDLEILVVDGSRELGNELLLPAGPLREPVSKLKEVDFCLVNGDKSTLRSEVLKESVNGSFKLLPCSWVQIATGKRLALENFNPVDGSVAVAAIGNPQRFFDTLAGLGINTSCIALDDHRSIDADLIEGLDKGLLKELTNEPESKKPGSQILMTMKDAVKCRDIATENCWALDVTLDMSEPLKQELLSAILTLVKQSHTLK